ncbi:hypothetical protein HDU79_004385 [Rhizoclosmatium sp. JEL0117]|nr:hypothetical protein HDU79_004385 [Rhizoclosmatium sp. JEL0117]
MRASTAPPLRSSDRRFTFVLSEPAIEAFVVPATLALNLNVASKKPSSSSSATALDRVDRVDRVDRGGTTEKTRTVVSFAGLPSIEPATGSLSHSHSHLNLVLDTQNTIPSTNQERQRPKTAANRHRPTLIPVPQLSDLIESQAEDLTSASPSTLSLNPQTQQITRPTPPKSAPSFTRSGYRLSSAPPLPSRPPGSASVTVSSAAYRLPYKVAREIKSAELVTPHNCQSRRFPRQQRKFDEIQAMENQWLEKHSLAACGLTFEQARIVKKRIASGEERRLSHRNSMFPDKCWPPRKASAFKKAGTDSAISLPLQSTQLNQGIDEELGVFAEEFKMSDDESDDLISNERRTHSFDGFSGFSDETEETFQWKVPSSDASSESEIEEFPIIAPSLLGDLLKPELIEKAKPTPVSVESSEPSQLGEYIDNASDIVSSSSAATNVRPSVVIQGPDDIDDTSSDNIITPERYRPTQSRSRQGSTGSMESAPSNLSSLSASLELEFKRNSKADEERLESLSLQAAPQQKDYRKIYARRNLIDPSALHDSFLQLSENVSKEDAVAEMEMRTVLRDLQLWAQSKFTPLFKDGLDGPHKFLASFQLPMMKGPEPNKLFHRLDTRNSLAANHTSSHLRSSRVTERASISTRNSVSTVANTNNSNADGEDKNGFEELLLLTPWKPALEDSKHARDKGKGVTLAGKTPRALIKRVKEANNVGREGVDVRGAPNGGELSLSVEELARVKAASRRPDTNVTARDEAQRLLQKRNKYGAGWYLDPNEWETAIKKPVFHVSSVFLAK